MKDVGAAQGEPRMDNRGYYFRYNKRSNCLGGQMRYVTADNRDYLLALVRGLRV
jgi:hypothetical protein